MLWCRPLVMWRLLTWPYNCQKWIRRRKAQEVIAVINAMIGKYQAQYPNVEFHKAGIIAMNNAFMTSAQQDSSTLVPLLMLLVVLVFWPLCCARFSVVATLIVIISSIVATMGLSGWAGCSWAPQPWMFQLLVLTLAVAGLCSRDCGPWDV